MNIRSICILILLLLAIPVRADIVVITHPDNPLESLSEKDVQNIFMGRLRMFPNSNDEPQALDLPENNPTFEEFYKILVNMNAAKIKRYRTYYLFSGKGKIPDQADDENDVITKVQANRTAIGYVNATHNLEKVKVVFRIKEK